MTKYINPPAENFGFQLLNYDIEHQGQAVLDILVDMEYKEGIGESEYPDFVPITDFVNNFLVNYPNETDFWEIVNKNLVETLLTEPIPTPDGIEYNLDEILAGVSVEFQVQSSSSNVDIPHSSQVVGILEEGTVELAENFGFQLLNYDIEHQGQAVLDILVDLDYKEGIEESEYPNFVPIADFVNDFLVNYPNETDFWEIVNKNLVETLLTEPIPTPDGIEYNLDEVLDGVSVEFQVQSSSSDLNIPRSSQAVGTLEEETVELAENFGFQLLNYDIEHQGQAVVDILVDLDYKEGIGESEYPDFVPIADFINDFLVNYPNETDFWEIANKNLVETLLTEPIPTPYGIEYNLDEILDGVSVEFQVKSDSSNVDIPHSSKVVQSVEKLEPLPKVVFGTVEDDVFDTEIPDEQQFVGNNQIIFTGSGNDLVDITFAPGGEISRVDLGSGDDVIFAGSNHRIIAGAGMDLMFLGAGEGNNLITGGVGETDQFWLVTDAADLPTQANIITDFTIAEDVIGFGNTNLDFNDLNLIQDGNNTLINALETDIAILLNTQASDLTAADFVFA